ncbi:hypothetical protein [Streptomyces sp. CBMA29]|uniref:hypothetical protein n=1 Tax=Streptomyces sp. CBMA29 TaxID=1896314 RepID=UPI0016620A9B|nr:hypothetical protein [Streptomyces sp. CBMA29]MBD0735420.1 hypothetical protein [Streptomyces sp. CBMA29]
MTFFERFPEPPLPETPERRRRDPWEQPEHVLPASAPGEVIVVRTADAAVWLGSVRAYPNGFACAVRVVRREAGAGAGRTPGPFAARYRHADPFEAEDRNTGLRLGIEYADGRRAATGQGLPMWFQGPRDEDLLRIQAGGGGGNALCWDQDLWISPLPPDGPVTLVGTWPDIGVDEQRAGLDGTAIRAAAARALELWPADEFVDDGLPGASVYTVTVSTSDDGTEDAQDAEDA